MEDDPKNFIDLFIKDEKWSYEKEYRFVTFVENENERLVTTKTSLIKEVILGNKISSVSEKEIIQCLRDRYNSEVALLKVEENDDRGLRLRKIQY